MKPEKMCSGNSYERRRRQQESSSDKESQDTDEKGVTLEESKQIKEGKRMMKREENSSGDEKHEIEGNREVQGPQAASERVGTVTEENMELDSDKEYDDLTKQVWEKAQRSGATNDEEVHGQISVARFLSENPLLSRTNYCYRQ